MLFFGNQSIHDNNAHIYMVLHLLLKIDIAKYLSIICLLSINIYLLLISIYTKSVSIVFDDTKCVSEGFFYFGEKKSNL